LGNGNGNGFVAAGNDVFSGLGFNSRSRSASASRSATPAKAAAPSRSLAPARSSRPAARSVVAARNSKPAINTVSNYGAIASNLKSLNAANASATARANAAPNSRVGRIASYEVATLGVISLTDDLSALRDQLDDTVQTTVEFVDDNISENSTATPEEIAAAIDALDPESPDYEDDLAAVAASITGLDPDQSENDQAIGQMAESISATIAAQDEQAELAGAIDEAENQLAEQQSEQIDALAAAYSPNDVQDLEQPSLEALHDMLGLSAESIPDVSPRDATDADE